jgi:3-isopropylmalate/(R)-2-methylmalate dehydratase small subunit
VGGVLAESFGRIYFRNCVAIAFPNLACPGIHSACQEGDEIEFELRSGLVRNLRSGAELRGTPYTREMLAIVEAGGLLEVLKQRLAAEPAERST